VRFALFTTNLAGGGAEKALAKIGSGLAERGHDVEFIVCEDAGRHAAPAGCRFTALSARAGHGWLGKRRLAWKLARLLRESKHELLVSTLPFADEVAALSRAPRHACPSPTRFPQKLRDCPTTRGRAARTAIARSMAHGRWLPSRAAWPMTCAQRSGSAPGTSA
jgi:hypothetical protein